MEVSMQVAVLGTGLLGSPVAERLHSTGHTVTVYNRTQQKMDGLRRLGLAAVTAARDAVRSADCILLLLSDAAAIRSVLFNQARHHLARRTIIQMGTIGPSESTAIQQEVTALNGEYCEAPVLGSVAEAHAGSLLLLFGGRRDQLTRWSDVLGSLSREPKYVGHVGKAAALKLALNQLIAAETAAFSLSLALIQQAHVDVDLFMDVLRASALFAPTFEKKLPRLLSRDYSRPNFSARHLLKDVRLILDTAKRSGLMTSGLEGVTPLISEVIDCGLADADYSAIFEAVRPQS
jgi:3-hydroxyisobutyrate dehydrogenase